MQILFSEDVVRLFSLLSFAYGLDFQNVIYYNFILIYDVLLQEV